MLIVIAMINVAIALLCFVLTWRMVRFGRQVTQLNRNLNRWTVLLEDTLARQAIALTERRADFRQWQLIYLQWQWHQRRLAQAAKFLQLVRLMHRRRLL